MPAKIKARFWCIKGKVLEILPNYNKDAEACLSKAVKLEPNLIEAWNLLGHSFWKKNDLNSAKNCYSTALSLVRCFFFKKDFLNLFYLL